MTSGFICFIAIATASLPDILSLFAIYFSSFTKSIASNGHTLTHIPQPLQCLKSKSRRLPSLTGIELSGQNGTQSIQCLHLSSLNTGIITLQSPVSTRRDVAGSYISAPVVTSCHVIFSLISLALVFIITTYPTFTSSMDFFSALIFPSMRFSFPRNLCWKDSFIS